MGRLLGGGLGTTLERGSNPGVAQHNESRYGNAFGSGQRLQWVTPAVPYINASPLTLLVAINKDFCTCAVALRVL